MINEQTVKLKVASTSVEYARWGEITGNIESQTDLMNLLGERDLDDIQEAITQGLDDIDTAKEEAIEEIDQHGGVTEAVKQALLNCFAHVAWIDDQGQTYYDALEDALYPPANLVSISAVYTQSGTVYDNQTLDSLKSDLVVTATYSDSSTETVPSADYTLSGTLTEGTSTITVSYDGKTATFNVTVVLGWDYEWTYTDGALTDNGWTVTSQMGGTASLESDGLLLSGTQNGSVISFSNANWKRDNVEAYYEVMFLSSSTNGQKVLGISKNGSEGARFSINTNTPNMMEGSTLKAITGLQFEFNKWYTIVLELSNGSVSLSVDGDQVYTSASLATANISNTAVANVGSGSFKLKSIKFRSISQ